MESGGKVRIGKELPTSFEMNAEIGQGDEISLILFSIVIED